MGNSLSTHGHIPGSNHLQCQGHVKSRDSQYHSGSTVDHWRTVDNYRSGHNSVSSLPQDLPPEEQIITALGTGRKVPWQKSLWQKSDLSHNLVGIGLKRDFTPVLYLVPPGKGTIMLTPWSGLLHCLFSIRHWLWALNEGCTVLQYRQNP